MPKLSKRLETIASLVPFGARVCDIGTDHGYLSIELAKSGNAVRVISTDINEKPLLRAKENISLAKVEGIELRLCDGLAGISSQEVDTVVIAGMGGEVISGILERGADVAENNDKTFILQPTTSPEFLRDFLCKKGYYIISETPIFENGKLYSIMHSKFYGEAKCYEPYFSYIGKIKPDSEEGRLYIAKQYKRCYNCQLALENIKEKQAEYNYYKSVAAKLQEILETVKE